MFPPSRTVCLTENAGGLTSSHPARIRNNAVDAAARSQRPPSSSLLTSHPRSLLSIASRRLAPRFAAWSGSTRRRLKTRERYSVFGGSRVALLLYSQPGHRQNRSPRAGRPGQASTSSIRRIGTAPAAGSSAARPTILTASISRLPRISISCSGHSERSSPARDTVSSETTS